MLKASLPFFLFGTFLECWLVAPFIVTNTATLFPLLLCYYLYYHYHTGLNDYSSFILSQKSCLFSILSKFEWVLIFTSFSFLNPQQGRSLTCVHLNIYNVSVCIIQWIFPVHRVSAFMDKNSVVTLPNVFGSGDK